MPQTPNRDPAFDEHVLKIHHVIDKLDYYRLLGVKKTEQKALIKRSFLKITSKFHPDRHRDAPPRIREAIYDIFKRLNEAYRTLIDDHKRKLYDEQLANGNIRFSTDIRMSATPKTPIDTITSKDARLFYQKAEECLNAGNILQADLNARMAKSKEPQSKAIQALIDKVNAAKKKR